MTKRNAEALALLNRIKLERMQATSGTVKQIFPWYVKSNGKTLGGKSKGKGGR